MYNSSLTLTILWDYITVTMLVCTKIFMIIYLNRRYNRGFPGGAVVESLPANAGDTGSSPGLGRSHMPRSN